MCNTHDNTNLQTYRVEILKLLLLYKKIVLYYDNDVQKDEKEELIERIFKKISQIKSLSNNKSKYYRELTILEKKINLVKLEESFDSLQYSLEKELEAFFNKEYKDNKNKIEKQIKNKEFDKIEIFKNSSMALIIYDFFKKAIEEGKKEASKRIEEPRPSTPQEINKIAKIESKEKALDFENNLNLYITREAVSGLKNGLDIDKIKNQIEEKIEEKSSILTRAIVGATIGEAINIGRRTVFKKYEYKIKAYRRVEILDKRICPTCLALDGREIPLNDPFAEIGQIHYNCRGFWDVILVDEVEEDYEPKGIPPSLRNRFETDSEGHPKINAFKPIKTKKP
jgi:hypothetical protein